MQNRYNLPSGASLNAAWAESVPTTSIDSEMAAISAYLMRLAAIRNARAPLLQLAPELLDLIFDHLYEEARTFDLQACSLVCRTFTHPSQTRIFSSLRLYTPRDVSRALQLSRARPDLYAACRKISIQGRLLVDRPTNPARLAQKIEWTRCVDSTDLPGLFNTLTLVQEVHLVEFWPGCKLLESPARESLYDIFSRTRALTLEKFWLADDWELYHFLLSFKALRCLTLKAASSILSEDNFYGVPSDPERSNLQTIDLRYLSLDDSCSRDVIVRAPLYIARDTLRTLKLDASRVNDDEAIFTVAYDKMFRRCGGSLQELSFTCNTIDDTRYLIGAVSRHAPYIRELNLALPSLQLPSLELLQALRCHAIDVLVLRTTSRRVQFITLDHLISVFNTLCSFPSLRDLGVLQLITGQDAVHMGTGAELQQGLQAENCVQILSDSRDVESRAAAFFRYTKDVFDLGNVIQTSGKSVTLHMYRRQLLYYDYLVQEEHAELTRIVLVDGHEGRSSKWFGWPLVAESNQQPSSHNIQF